MVPEPGSVGFTRAMLREIDRLAVERYSMPSILLMENAARGLASVAMEMLDLDGSHPGSSSNVLILVCPGNNGGDGLAAARHLHNHGVAVRCLLARRADAYTGDAAINLRIARQMGLALHDVSDLDAKGIADRAADEQWDLVIDALFGTGLGRPIEGAAASMVELAHRCAAAGSGVLAADLPSGLDCDTGKPHGPVVHADVTAAFVGAKCGFATLDAQTAVGEVVVVDIGVPRELVEAIGPVPEAADPAARATVRAEGTGARGHDDRGSVPGPRAPGRG